MASKMSNDELSAEEAIGVTVKSRLIPDRTVPEPMSLWQKVLGESTLPLRWFPSSSIIPPKSPCSLQLSSTKLLHNGPHGLRKRRLFQRIAQKNSGRSKRSSELLFQSAHENTAIDRA